MVDYVNDYKESLFFMSMYSQTGTQKKEGRLNRWVALLQERQSPCCQVGNEIPRKNTTALVQNYLPQLQKGAPPKLL